MSLSVSDHFIISQDVSKRHCAS